eukprot:XP_011618918.1 PREDICTED: olfactory receptor 4E1-like [Takifugu rubripes]
MDNYTFNSFTLQLEGLKVTEVSVYPVFFFFLVSYIFIIVANIAIVALIFIDSSLHQPMYLLFCNLPFNDVLGNSILIPHLLMDLLRPPSERLITYYECVAQAFTTHMFGTTSHTVLIIMAFDRYVAICNPLRYAAIMNHRMVIKLTISAWAVAFVLVGILLGLTIRLNRCRTLITNPYCDNASLFKLSLRKPGTQNTSKRRQYAGHDSTSPSTGASWTSTTLLGMVPVKVTQEAAIQDVAPMNPRLFLKTVSPPINQELETMSLPTDIQNALDHR